MRSWRTAVVASIAVMASTVSMTAHTSTATAADQQPRRASAIDTTVGIAHANIPTRSGRDAFRATVRRMTAKNPDFITLNEQFSRSLPAIEAAAPGYTAYRNPTVPSDPGGKQARDTVVLWKNTYTRLDSGRIRIVDNDYTRYAGRRVTWDRFATWATVRRNSDGAVMSIISTHHMTNPAKYGPNKARRQRLYGEGMDELVHLTRQLRTQGPVFMGGDMNNHDYQTQWWSARSKMRAAGFGYHHNAVDYIFYDRSESTVLGTDMGPTPEPDHRWIYTNLRVNLDSLGPVQPPIRRQPNKAGVTTTFKVASFNILGSNHTRNSRRWARGTDRARLALTWLNNEGTSVMGVSEAQVDQMRTLTGSGKWRSFPNPKTSRNTQTAQSIAWRTSDWVKVGARTFTIPFHFGQRREQPVVRLKNRETGKQVWFINVHLTSGHSGRAVHERRVGINRIIAQVRRIQRADDRPVIVTGDMNDKAAVFCRITAGTTLKAAAGGSETGACRPPSRMRIDWVFGSSRLRFSKFRFADDARLNQITDHTVPVATVTFRG